MTGSKLTIVFRGLMVFHKKVGSSSIFEVGLLSPCHHGHPLHIPRIITYKNGVPDSVMLIGGLVDPMRRIWRLNVNIPVGGISTDEEGEFIRATHSHTTDYRWLIDLEDDHEFYGSLKDKIDTKRLNPVLRIPSGSFYTRLLSRKMNRQKDNGQATNFGRISAAVGCDITFNGPKPELVVADTNASIFTFDVDPDGHTLYEIANTPPDTYVPEPGEDHFQHYYEIFTSYLPKYKFSPGSGVTGPSPALCGAVRLGKMGDDL